MDDETSYELPSQYIGAFIKVIAKAYRQRVQFDQLLRCELNKDPHTVAPTSKEDMLVVADIAVDNADAEGWLLNLIEAVARDKPENLHVKAFYAKYKAFIQKQRANNLPDTASIVSYPPMASHITSLPPQGKQPQTHQFSEAWQTVEHLSHGTDVVYPGDGQMLPVASSVILPQPQNGPQFSFRYFRGAGCHSSGICKGSFSETGEGKRYDFSQRAFL